MVNSTNKPIETTVRLRGKQNLALWNPQTGERGDLKADVSENGGQPFTTVPLSLGAMKSVIYIDK